MSTEPTDVEEINRRRKRMIRSGRRKWVRRLFFTAASLLLLGTLTATIAWYVVRNKGIACRDAIVAKLDATDPNWRLDRLTADRNASLPPDGQNAATQALVAAKLIPKSFDEWAKKETWRSRLKPPHLPQPDEIEEARGAFAECEAAVRQARTVRQYTSGGFPLTFQEPDPTDTPFAHLSHVRNTVFLLDLDAIVSACDERGNDALNSCHAILATARGLGDEPTMLSMKFRSAIALIAVLGTERTLSWATAGDGQLSEIQAVFAAEADVPRLKYGLRGERAALYRLLENFDRREISLTKINGATGKPSLADQIKFIPVRATLPEQQATFLELMNLSLSASDRPHHERQKLFDDIDSRLEQMKPRYRLRYMLVNAYMPEVATLNDSETCVVAKLRCASVAVACERFRLKSGRYPESLADLPPSLLSAIPADPFTGQPLLYQRTDEGAVVYSTGRDLQDDGGVNLDPKAEKGGDIGFQLFAPAHRRKPPLPKPAPEQPEHP